MLEVGLYFGRRAAVMLVACWEGAGVLAAVPRLVARARPPLLRGVPDVSATCEGCGSGRTHLLLLSPRYCDGCPAAQLFLLARGFMCFPRCDLRELGPRCLPPSYTRASPIYPPPFHSLWC